MVISVRIVDHLFWTYVLSISFPVMYPTRFLEGEDISNNFLFNADRYGDSFSI